MIKRITLLRASRIAKVAMLKAEKRRNLEREQDAQYCRNMYDLDMFQCVNCGQSLDVPKEIVHHCPSCGYRPPSRGF